MAPKCLTGCPNASQSTYIEPQVAPRGAIEHVFKNAPKSYAIQSKQATLLMNFSGRSCNVQVHFALCSTLLSDHLRYGMIRRRSNKSIDR